MTTMNKRGSGVLLHVTSLPSRFGIGDLGPGAYRFADFLAATGQTYWQILPLSPTTTFNSNSPYSSYSAFSGNPLLISPQLLVEEGFLEETDLKTDESFTEDHVDFRTVIRFKSALLKEAYERNRKAIADNAEFVRFCEEQRSWLDTAALFVALKEHFRGVAWTAWTGRLRDREAVALEQWGEKLADRVTMEKFFQFLFFKQWRALKAYCNERGIRIISDLPIYVSHDSADVWQNPGVFKLNSLKKPVYVAGVPPDYFSKTGQLWGNPVYDWEMLRHRRYDWWRWRIAHTLELCDIFRLDHFRGFVAYWELDAGEKTAANGRWVETPVDDFFDTLLPQFPNLPIIAEDLGIITPDVREVMDRYGFPGMKVLMFGFDGHLLSHPYLPHNYRENCVVYTGTHDNNTVRGWYDTEATDVAKRNLELYLGKPVDENNLNWQLIELAMHSVADTAITPMQDLIGLGEKARMNVPATVNGNWQWRLQEKYLSRRLIEKLKKLTADSDRG